MPVRSGVPVHRLAVRVWSRHHMAPGEGIGGGQPAPKKIKRTTCASRAQEQQSGGTRPEDEEETKAAQAMRESDDAAELGGQKW